MARGQQIVRQWKLIQALQNTREGLSLRQFAARFHRNPRTIMRDLEILAKVGFPLAYSEDRFGKRFWKWGDRKKWSVKQG